MTDTNQILGRMMGRCEPPTVTVKPDQKSDELLILRETVRCFAERELQSEALHTYERELVRMSSEMARVQRQNQTLADLHPFGYGRCGYCAWRHSAIRLHKTKRRRCGALRCRAV